MLREGYRSRGKDIFKRNLLHHLLHLTLQRDFPIENGDKPIFNYLNSPTPYLEDWYKIFFCWYRASINTFNILALWQKGGSKVKHHIFSNMPPRFGEFSLIRNIPILPFQSFRHVKNPIHFVSYQLGKIRGNPKEIPRVDSP